MGSASLLALNSGQVTAAAAIALVVVTGLGIWVSRRSFKKPPQEPISIRDLDDLAKLEDRQFRAWERPLRPLEVDITSQSVPDQEDRVRKRFRLSNVFVLGYPAGEQQATGVFSEADLFHFTADDD